MPAPPFAQYSITKHRLPTGNEIAVNATGSYAKPGESLMRFIEKHIKW